MITSRWLLAPLAAALLGLIVACGGDKDGDANKSGSGGAGGGVSTELNLSNVANDLMELRSFRFAASLKLDYNLGATGDPDDDLSAGLASMFMAMFKDIKMEGAYVAPDSMELKMSLAGEDVQAVQIGNRAWINEGRGWKQTDADSSDLSFLGDPTGLALDMLPSEVLKNAKTKSEKMNGVETTRYSFDKKALEGAAKEMGEATGGLDEIDEAKLDVWLTADNIPVKITMDFKGKAEDGSKMAIQLEFNVTDLNSNDIKIKAPI